MRRGRQTPSKISAGLRSLALATALVAGLAACKDESARKAQGQAQQQPQAVPVSVVTVQPEALPVTSNLPGRIAPTRIAEVRPRVSGIVIERVFQQGSMVKQNDVLYRIDPAPFQVRVESAKAQLARAEASQLQAKQQSGRIGELRDRAVASQQQLDNATAALAQADADVAAARANLAAAELDLQYSVVRAPIGGRIGRALITEGALVNSAQADSLATIQQLDPVYADFTQSVGDLIALRQALKLGALTSADPGAANAKLQFDNGAIHPQAGRLLFSEATVDATTGQVTLRAEFPNPDGLLLPGMYVRVLVDQGTQANAIAVPQQAVQRDSAGRAQLFVVSDGKVELRSVTAGRVVDTRTVIDDGLKPGEQVVVEGFQKIRAGAAVTAQPWGQTGGQKPPATAPAGGKG